METVITVSKRSSYFIYSHYLKSFMALFFSMGTNFHHIRCVYDWECILTGNVSSVELKYSLRKLIL